MHMTDLRLARGTGRVQVAGRPAGLDCDWDEDVDEGERYVANVDASVTDADADVDFDGADMHSEEADQGN